MLTKRLHTFKKMWITKHSPISVISIRPERWNLICKDITDRKMSLQGIQLFHGTNGQALDKKRWQISKRITDHSYKTMTRGQIACFDSHKRVWKHIVASGLPYACVAEDDMRLYKTFEQEEFCNDIKTQIDKYVPDFELLFLQYCTFFKGPIQKWFGPATDVEALKDAKGSANGAERSKADKDLKGAENPKVAKIPQLYRGSKCQCMYLYVITLDACKKLLSLSNVINEPVDMFISKLADRNYLNTVNISPQMDPTFVPKNSDTEGIK